VLGLALNLMVLFERGRADRVRWRALWPMLAAALPGMGAGMLLLDALSKPVLQVIVGVCVLGAVLVVAVRRDTTASARTPSRRSAWAAGVTSGALTTSTSLSGPPLVLWLEGHGLGPGELRVSLAASFLALNLSGAVALLAAGGTGRMPELALLAGLFALTVAGYLAGARAFRRLDAERFRTVVLGLVVVAGLASVGAGLAAL
jgi:uncharacterized protein